MTHAAKLLPSSFWRSFLIKYIYIRKTFLLIIVHKGKQILVVDFDLSLYIEIPSSKFRMLCLLFAFQNDNSYYFPFSCNASRIGLVIAHCIVKKTKEKDRGEIFRADDEHALTHIDSFFSFSFSLLVSSCILQPLSYIKLLRHLVGVSEKYARVVSKISLSATTNRRARGGISITYIILAYSC